MSGHTPGPWFVKSYGGDQYVRHWCVSGPSVHMYTSNKASLPDMYLIAAAPDLLEALKNLENDDGSIPSHAWEMVQKAIAKATGEKA